MQHVNDTALLWLDTDEPSTQVADGWDTSSQIEVEKGCNTLLTLSKNSSYDYVDGQLQMGSQ